MGNSIYSDVNAVFVGGIRIFTIRLHYSTFIINNLHLSPLLPYLMQPIVVSCFRAITRKMQIFNYNWYNNTDHE